MGDTLDCEIASIQTLNTSLIKFNPTGLQLGVVTNSLKSATISKHREHDSRLRHGLRRSLTQAMQMYAGVQGEKWAF